jgi:hypothetical protein
MKSIGYREAGGVEVLTISRLRVLRLAAIFLIPSGPSRSSWLTSSAVKGPATADDYMVLGFDPADVVEAVFLFKPGDELFYAAPGTPDQTPSITRQRKNCRRAFVRRCGCNAFDVYHRMENPFRSEHKVQTSRAAPFLSSTERVAPAP